MQLLKYENIVSENIEENFVNDFKRKFYKIKEENKYNEVLFLCVGTDRITGDCFGPIVGTKLSKELEEYNFSNINIYGTLENPLNYEKVEKIIQQINEKVCLIVIDAALSKKENIGKIFVSNQKTILGKGLNKNKLEIGDISVKAVVGKDYKIPQYNFKVLQNISLNAVISLSEIVSKGIIKTIKEV